jgi:hypothetical protein
MLALGYYRSVLILLQSFGWPFAHVWELQSAWLNHHSFIVTVAALRHVVPRFEHKKRKTLPISLQNGTFTIQPGGNTGRFSAT